MRLPLKQHAKIFTLVCLAVWLISLITVLVTGSVTYNRSCVDPKAHCALRGYGFGGKVVWVLAVLANIAFWGLIYGLMLMLLTKKRKRSDK